MPIKCAPFLPFFACATAAAISRSVVSTVSVRIEHCHDVTPRVAKKWLIFAKPASSAALTSTPAPPCVCRSIKPGTTRSPAASYTSSSGTPAAFAVPGVSSARIFPSSSTTSSFCRRPCQNTSPFIRKVRIV